MADSKNFDPIWEEFYSNGEQLNKYPFNYVPNFFFKSRPRGVEPKDVKVLEVGFGAGNNLWMCAREGFSVCGVDAAPSGVKFAQDRFAAEGLEGDLRVGDFTDLPFEDNSLDMAMNRQALTQVGFTASKKAVAEIYRCLKPGGVFWSNMFSDQSDHDGDMIGDGLWENMTTGNLVGVGQTAFHSRQDIEDMYGDGWELEELNHQIHETLLDSNRGKFCEWFVTARKKA